MGKETTSFLFRVVLPILSLYSIRIAGIDLCMAMAQMRPPWQRAAKETDK